MKIKFSKKILKFISLAIVLCVLMTFSLNASAELPSQRGEHPDELDADPLKLDCKSAILIEANTQTVLYEKNADEPLPPASVTKVMTLLLVMEAIENGKIGYADNVENRLKQLNNKFILIFNNILYFIIAFHSINYTL